MFRNPPRRQLRTRKARLLERGTDFAVLCLIKKKRERSKRRRRRRG
jgi:hypothetical protein